MEKPAGPCVIVIFGASGDLTMRKLIPALYNLSAEKLLPDEFAVIGFARKDLTNEQFREQLRGNLCQFVSCELNSPELQDWISQRLYYVQGDYDDPSSYEKLKTLLLEIDQKHKTQENRLFCLATPPNLFGTITRNLSILLYATQAKAEIMRRPRLIRILKRRGIMDAMTWLVMFGNGRIAGTIRTRILRFCATAPGSTMVSVAGALAVSTSGRASGSTASVFVAPGLLNFSLLPFFNTLILIAGGGRD